MLEDKQLQDLLDLLKQTISKKDHTFLDFAKGSIKYLLSAGLACANLFAGATIPWMWVLAPLWIYFGFLVLAILVITIGFFAILK